MTTSLEARCAAALRALTERTTRAPVVNPAARFPGETQPSDGLPDDPLLAADMHEARHATFSDLD
ncbi:hypothetical protein [Streptomyces hebeiensis]